jgi:hypothetical protein
MFQFDEEFTHAFTVSQEDAGDRGMLVIEVLTASERFRRNLPP